MARDNKEIGRFDLTDLPPSPRGMPQIEVAFDIDADGILHVSAKDISTGKVQKIRIEAQSGLNESEIQRILKDAELHAEEDKKRKEEIDIKNEADGLAFRAQKSLSEYKDKLPADVVADVQSKIDDLKKALEGSDTQAIKSAKETLESHMQRIGEAMSKAGAGQGPQQPQADAQKAQGQASEKQGKEDIEEVEAEIIEDEDKQK